MTTRRKLLALDVAVIIIGGLFLVWFYCIDGIYIDKPIVFIHNVNPEQLQLTKHVYHPGDTVSYYTAFCKTRNAVPAVQWTMADGTLTLYPPHTGNSSGLPTGCYPQEGTTTATAIEKIPVDHEPTCDAYFKGVVDIDIGGGRVVTHVLQTQKFCIR
jgi:hypothetical protein